MGFLIWESPSSLRLHFSSISHRISRTWLIPARCHGGWPVTGAPMAFGEMKMSTKSHIPRSSKCIIWLWCWSNLSLLSLWFTWYCHLCNSDFIPLHHHLQIFGATLLTMAVERILFLGCTKWPHLVSDQSAATGMLWTTFFLHLRKWRAFLSGYGCYFQNNGQWVTVSQNPHLGFSYTTYKVILLRSVQEP